MVRLFLLLLLLLVGCATETVYVMYDKTCDVEGTIIKETPRFNIVEVSDFDPNDPCVFNQVSKGDLTKGVPSEPNFKEEIRKQKLNRGLEKKDVSDDVVDVLRNKHLDIEYPFTLYVTPDNVVIQDLAAGKNLQQLYAESQRWVWISEEDLNGVAEHWFLPEDFILNTPSMSTNPTGTIASDCSEQANTLASLLIASGESPDNVRVVLGLVDFDGTQGGHAYVEVFRNGRWLALDPTAGDYVENGEYIQLTSYIRWNYFLFEDYPIVERWYYYNNVYFYDVQSRTGNAPESWKSVDSRNNNRPSGPSQGLPPR